MSNALSDKRVRAAVARFRPGNTGFARAVTWAVSTISKWVMTRRNSLAIEGLEHFRQVQDRGGRGLLTFSNHVSLLDDPFLVANFRLGGYDDLRWVAADALNFFGGPLRGLIFNAGKCVPIVRGAGDDQPGFRFLLQRLAAGDWVHLFPEGGRTRDPLSRLRHPFKAGIGRLLDETRPLALPFYHHGMHGVLPLGARFPGRGQAVRLVFGEATDCDGAFADAVAPNLAGRARWMALAEWAFGVLRGIERRVHPDAEDDDAVPSSAEREERSAEAIARK